MIKLGIIETEVKMKKAWDFCPKCGGTITHISSYYTEKFIKVLRKCDKCNFRFYEFYFFFCVLDEEANTLDLEEYEE